MQGDGTKIGICDYHNRREVVAEIKLHNGDKIQLCHEILMGSARKIEHKLQRMSDKSEAVRKTS